MCAVCGTVGSGSGGLSVQQVALWCVCVGLFVSVVCVCVCGVCVWVRCVV